MSTRLDVIRVITICAAAAIAVPLVTPIAAGQRHEDWEWQGNYQRLTRLDFW